MEGIYDVIYTVEDSSYVRPLIRSEKLIIQEIKEIAEKHIKVFYFPVQVFEVIKQ